MSGFPKLIPAFTTHIVIDPPIPVGDVSSGGPLTVAPFTSTSSFLRSEPTYPIQVDAVYIHGSDFIRQDPSGKHNRITVNSVLKDKSGATVALKYSGIWNGTPGFVAVLTGVGAKTTEFGDAFVHMLFETGSEELKDLEKKIYVGSGRFIIEAGKATTVEYKISEVAV